MQTGIIGFQTNPSEIQSGSFPAMMIRRMVEVKTGDTSDAEYDLAARYAAKKLGLQYDDDRLNLTHVSLGTMEYISAQIAEVITMGRSGETEATI